MPDGGTLTIETANVDARRGTTPSDTWRRRRATTSMLAVSDTGWAWTPRRRPASSSRSSPPRSRARARAWDWPRSTASSSRAKATSGSTASPAGHHVQGLPAPGRQTVDDLRGQQALVPRRPATETILVVEDGRRVRQSRPYSHRAGLHRASGGWRRARIAASQRARGHHPLAHHRRRDAGHGRAAAGGATAQSQTGRQSALHVRVTRTTPWCGGAFCRPARHSSRSRSRRSACCGKSGKCSATWHGRREAAPRKRTRTLERGVRSRRLGVTILKVAGRRCCAAASLDAAGPPAPRVQRPSAYV